MRIWIKDIFDRVKNLTRGHPDTCTDGCNRMETLMDTWPQLAHPPKINEISQKFKTSKISRKSRRFSSRLKKWNPTMLDRVGPNRGSTDRPWIGVRIVYMYVQCPECAYSKSQLMESDCMVQIVDRPIHGPVTKAGAYVKNVRKEKALDALNINHRTHQSRHAKQQNDPWNPTYSRAHPESNWSQKSRMITILNTIDYFSCFKLIFHQFDTVFISNDYGHMVSITWLRSHDLWWFLHIWCHIIWRI